MSGQGSKMESYYRMHAPIYDLTRWSFLFGRDELIEQAVAGLFPNRVLDVGCGTGRNLAHLAERCPHAELIGVDASSAMLERCRVRLSARTAKAQLRHGLYEASNVGSGPYDLIVFSYSLSMFNPGWGNALEAAKRDLRPEGRVAVCDFHDSPGRCFRWWMSKNHVCLEGHLLPELRNLFPNNTERIRTACRGLWRYFLFVGIKSPVPLI